MSKKDDNIKKQMKSLNRFVGKLSSHKEKPKRKYKSRARSPSQVKEWLKTRHG